MECKRCGCYIPEGAEVCVACGMPVRTKYDVIVKFNGKSYKCYLSDVEIITDNVDLGRGEDGKPLGCEKRNWYKFTAISYDSEKNEL